MYAALKGTSIDAVIFRGLDDLRGLPGWFNDLVFEQCCLEYSNGTVRYAEMQGMEDTWVYEDLVPNKHVIIRNRVESIMKLDFASFTKDFYSIGGHYAALKEDCVEWFVFTHELISADTPDWLIDFLDEDYMVADHNPVRILYFDDNGRKVAISPNSIFIRNYWGNVTYMSPRDFYVSFETGESRLYEDNLKSLSYIKR